jgi:hypothetical protein
MTLLIARLNHKAQPLERGDLFEDPLHAFLEEWGLGEVTGGGTQLSNLGEVEYCDVEIDLVVDPDGAMKQVAKKLEELGAPIGSKLTCGSNELSFGKLEGIGVYLNGSDLPAVVYRDCDANHVYDEFERLLGDNGSIQSHWQGPSETALYMYGPSFTVMQECIAEFLASYPLCAKARVVKIAG